MTREQYSFSRAGRFIFYAVSDPLFALMAVELVGDLEPQVSSPTSIGEHLVIDLRMTTFLDFASQLLMADQRDTLINRL